SRRQATAEHPFGYGRDRYVYGFLVALMLFSAGGLFALYEGIHKILHPHPLESPIVAFAVLALAIILESFSLRTAVHESRPLKGSSSWPQFIRRAKVPELPVVLLEDVAALVGLVLALFGVTMATITDNGVWDGIGTVCIGALLITVAVILVVETKSLLLGESASPAMVDAIATNLVGPGVERIIHLRTMHLGPDELLIGAKLAMSPGATLADAARAIDDAEQRGRAGASRDEFTAAVCRPAPSGRCGAGLLVGVSDRHPAATRPATDGRTRRRAVARRPPSRTSHDRRHPTRPRLGHRRQPRAT